MFKSQCIKLMFKSRVYPTVKHRARIQYVWPLTNVRDLTFKHLTHELAIINILKYLKQ